MIISGALAGIGGVAEIRIYQMSAFKPARWVLDLFNEPFTMNSGGIPFCCLLVWSSTSNWELVWKPAAIPWRSRSEPSIHYLLRMCSLHYWKMISCVQLRRSKCEYCNDFKYSCFLYDDCVCGSPLIFTSIPEEPTQDTLGLTLLVWKESVVMGAFSGIIFNLMQAELGDTMVIPWSLLQDWGDSSPLIHAVATIHFPCWPYRLRILVLSSSASTCGLPC